MKSGSGTWQKAVLRLFHLSPLVTTLVCVVLFGLVALADLLTPPALNLSVFYVFVVLIATWNAGWKTGLAFALLSTLVQTMVLLQHPPDVIFSLIWFAWLLNRSLILFIVIGLTYPLRVLFDRHEAAGRIDALTGAANQRYFREILDMELTRSARSGAPFSVALLDCDDFKLVNDQFGHLIGDRLLRAVADTSRRCTRRADTVARLGGDEFAILLPEANEPQALEVLRRLQSSIEKESFGPSWRASVSIGLATFQGLKVQAEDVIALCDSLMYRAKRAGKGQIVHEQALATQPSHGPQADVAL